MARNNTVTLIKTNADAMLGVIDYQTTFSGMCIDFHTQEKQMETNDSLKGNSHILQHCYMLLESAAVMCNIHDLWPRGLNMYKYWHCLYPQLVKPLMRITGNYFHFGWDWMIFLPSCNYDNSDSVMKKNHFSIKLLLQHKKKPTSFLFKVFWKGRSGFLAWQFNAVREFTELVKMPNWIFLKQHEGFSVVY